VEILSTSTMSPTATLCWRPPLRTMAYTRISLSRSGTAPPQSSRPTYERPLPRRPARGRNEVYGDVTRLCLRTRRRSRLRGHARRGQTEPFTRHVTDISPPASSRFPAGPGLPRAAHTRDVRAVPVLPRPRIRAPWGKVSLPGPAGASTRRCPCRVVFPPGRGTGRSGPLVRPRLSSRRSKP
jgi:hypothetical protein